MKKTVYAILLSLFSIYAYASSIALSEVPSYAIEFADKYFSDYYLYRAMDLGGNYSLIFKGGLKIYFNRKGEWKSVMGGGNEISIAYIEDKVKNSVKKEYPNEKIIYIQKKSREYKIEFKSGKKINIDFEGNITKSYRDY
ncbi:PepSY-like domain-containing protein [uncultured Brachyspira sp.]|uniref:PepSY-like domain-containing protein n=1 Tax=uncultured Brachyspira sp. TaxID=221953 RepID=UPI0025DF44CD|nr:PepSY-like domain-containing protein [uncultured Brachyspira sp.]